MLLQHKTCLLSLLLDALFYSYIGMYPLCFSVNMYSLMHFRIYYYEIVLSLMFLLQYNPVIVNSLITEYRL